MVGCANSRIVQPLNNNQWQVAASIGGPVIEKKSGKEAIPLTSVSAAFGMSQQVTAFAGVHPSTATYGVYQVDAGIAHEIISPFNLQPGITYSAVLNSFIDRQEAQVKFYPQIDVNVYWLLPYRNDFFYIGVSNWFELATKKAHQEKQETRWIPSIHTGYTLQFDRYGFNLELKYIAPFTSNRDLLLNYVSPTNQGAVAAYFSLSRKF